MLDEEMLQGLLDNFASFIKKEIRVCLFGTIQADNGDGTYNVSFNVKGLQPLSFIATRQKNIKTKIYKGYKVKVEFADFFEKFFLKQDGEKTGFLHTLSNGVITEVIDLQDNEPEIATIYDKDKFDTKNSNYGLKQLANDFKTLISSFQTIMLGTLTTFISSMTPTGATPQAQQAFLQEVNNLTTKLNELQNNMSKLFI